MLPQIHLIDDFDQRHGEPIRHADVLLFPDGAWRHVSPYGTMAPPPNHPVDLAKAKVQYLEIAIQQAEAEYRDQRVWMLTNTGLATDSDNEAHLDTLKALRENVIACRSRLAEAHQSLLEIDPREAGHFVTDEEREALMESDMKEAEAVAAWQELIREIDSGLPDSPE